VLVEFEELVDDGEKADDKVCGMDVVGVPVAGEVVVVVIVVVGEVPGEVIAVPPAGAA
jgi:hypothetical protein